MCTDEMISEAVIRYAEAMNRSLPELTECKHRFSKAFQRKMRRLLCRVEHPARYRFAQAAAILLLVMTIAFTAIMVVCPTARAAVLGWVRKRFENVITYRYAGDTLEESDTMQYGLSVLPEGYQEAGIFFNDGNWFAVYTDDAQNALHFSYALAPRMLDFCIKKNEGYTIETTVGDSPAYIYMQNNGMVGNVIVWTGPDPETVFYISAKLEPDTLRWLAEGVVQKK